jgi:hypothetical protein
MYVVLLGMKKINDRKGIIDKKNDIILNIIVAYQLVEKC